MIDLVRPIMKPINNAWLMVEPQSTQMMIQTKTPEELEQEAKESGWLSTWHEWSWWYPWYRLHIKINMNPVIDVGFSPILPGGETWDWEGLEIFAEVLEEFIQELIIDVVGIFVGYVIAKGFSLFPPTWALAAATLLVKAGIQGFLLWASWDNSEKMLAVGLANIIIG